MVKVLLIGIGFCLITAPSFGFQQDSTHSEVEEDIESVLEEVDTNDPESNAEQIVQLLQVGQLALRHRSGA